MNLRGITKSTIGGSTIFSLIAAYFLERDGWVLSPLGSLVGSGLTAAVAAQGVTWAKEHYRDKEKTERDRQFIALQLAVALERYAIECAMRSSTIGVSLEVAYQTQERPKLFPSLPPLELPAAEQWRWLPADLSSEVLSLTPQISFGAGSVQDAYEFTDEIGAANEAQRQLGIIGRAAWHLAERLRREHNIPVQAYVLGEWDFLKELGE